MNLKKLLFVLLLGLVVVFSSSADGRWVFETGSSKLNYQPFTFAEIHNYSNHDFYANGQCIPRRLTKNVMEHHIELKCDDYGDFDVYYSFDSIKLIITIYDK